jgi:hypothetical protein
MTWWWVFVDIIALGLGIGLGILLANMAVKAMKRVITKKVKDGAK